MNRLAIEQRIFDLNKRLDELAAAGRERAWTDEEHAEADGIEAELPKLERQLAVIKQRQARELAEEGHEDANVAAEREGATRAVGTNKVFGSFGEWLQSVKAATVEGDFGQRSRLINAAATGAGEAIDSDGGFLVPMDFATGIERRMTQMGQVLSRIDWTEVSGNGLVMKVIDETSRATGSRWGGVQGYWVDEGTAPTASNPKFAEIELKLRKLGALGYATEELLADASAMGSIYETAFAEELTWLVENAVFRGTGAGQPVGIIGHASTVSVDAEAGQGAASLEPENIVKMHARMPGRNRANAVWFMNQDIEPELFLLTLAIGTGGIPLYMPPNGLSQSPFGSLMGRPVIPIEYASTVGTVGDIVFADMSQYKGIRKGGVQQASSMHVRFAEGETAFRATYRVDGQPKWRSPLTPANGSNTLSPFVTLATRS